MPAQITRLPDRLPGPDGLVLRLWVPEEAEALGRAIAESAKHLRPWMAWIADEPLAVERRRERIVGWQRDWARGRDAVYGAFLDERILGGCGLHRRICPHGLEIGYWIHTDFLKHGLATRVADTLTAAAFRVPGIRHVEIHHDKANRASAGVPAPGNAGVVSDGSRSPPRGSPAAGGCATPVRRGRPTDFSYGSG